KKDFKANFEEHHLLARKAAAQSAVLLKNDNLLPIKAKEKICVIGEFAKITRYQGGGSSHIISTKIDNAYDEIVKINQLSNSNEIKYAIGYKIDEPKTDYNLIENALQIAEGCDKIVVFAGLPDSFESEGYDRKTLEIPQCQNDLITALCQKNKNVIVVLYNGAPIVMPWKNQVGAILTCYLAGQAVGGAAADLLFGKSVPCGKLSETYPEKIEDTPCFLSFPGYIDSSIYTEDIFVGYRYYDKKKIQPAFSFGFGLSYSSFEYSNFKISSNTLKENEKITVSFVIKNVGDFDANEIVQLYSGKSNPKFSCCEKDLKAFKKVFIKKGESICVDMLLSFDDLAEYNNADKRVVTESGDYKIIIAASSRNEDIKFKDKINVVSNFKESYIFHRNSTILDLVSNPKGKEIFDKIVKNNPEIIDMVFNGMEDDGSSFKQEMINNTTLRSLVYFSMGKFSEEMLENLLEEMK
ncbi:MAG: glycoside hydrolase family 3 C-terminal domain-containing protein, partial [Oscillospiraceae bacterium]